MESNAPTRTARPSDEDLLRRIAESRDRTAFEQLTQRFGKPAYNLALHLCGNAGMAEDSAQEAMVEVWLHANRYENARGQVRSWLLRIVANKAFALRTREGKLRKREMTKSGGKSLAAPDSAHDSFEDGELKSALRQMLARLPVADRQIVSLYFGAELSQDEIARTMDISQRMVSYRLKQVLEQLRQGLAAAGYAAASPLLASQSLGAAILNLEQVPTGLHTAIMRSLTSAAHGSTRTALTAGSWMLRLAGAALMATVAGLGWWTFQTSHKQPELPDPEKHGTAQDDSGARNRDVPKPRGWSWTFKEPNEALEFDVVNGAWTWTPTAGKGNAGAMHVEDSAKIAISEHLPKGCYLVTFDIANVSTKGIQAGALWENEGPATVLSNLSNAPRPASPGWLHVEIYLTEECRIAKMQNDVRQIVFAHRNSDSRLLITLVGSLLIDNISLNRLLISDAPDLQPYRSLVDRIPADERHGTVERLLENGDMQQYIQVTFPPEPEMQKE